MTTRYAAATTVPVDRTRNEIESVLKRYGSTAFAYATNDIKQVWLVEFLAKDRRVRFIVPRPKGKEGERQHDQDCRQRWRALLLAIKAKLEAVESGISLFESEFLANIVDPFTNKTVYEVAAPQIALSYEKKPQQLMLTSE